jgi:predicted enzyme related to lactoylglutathione lyase
MTTDREASRKYYAELFGWSYRESDMGPMGTYVVIKGGDREFGGMVPLEAEHGMPSHFMSYLTVEDVDAVCEKVPGLGGKVAVPAMEIPRTGRFAVLADAQGAYFSPFKYGFEPEAPPEGPPPHGTVCWVELLTTDPEAAASFYGEVCGWTTRSQDMGESGKYWMYMRGEEMMAGMMKLPPGAEAPPNWMVYFAVDDVDSAAKKAESLGSKLWVPPRDIPGMGRFSVVGDPQGTVFGIFQAK